MSDLPKPIDRRIGDPSAMQGARTFPLAAWVVSRAQAALQGVRQAFQPSATVEASRALAPIGPPPSALGTPGAPMPPTLSMPTNGPVRSMQRREPWFGPGQPPLPTAPRADVAGRAFDYQAGINMGSRPRQWSGVSFEQLRGLSTSLDIARLCIETRKDQMGRLTWSVLPKQMAGQAERPSKADDRCRMIEKFLRSPDRKHTWDGWLRMILEDQLVTDAVSLYVRRTLGGDVYAIEVVDGTLIKPLVDAGGRTPSPPEAAYQQILKGMAAIDYTSDELIYAPRNPRSDRIYGLPVMEQIVMTVNIAIRREIVKLHYFTDGNVPDAMVSVPEDWGSEQIADFQAKWDVLMKGAQNQAGIKFVPGKMNFQPTRSDGMLMGQFDEWLARVICFAFSLPPTAFVQQQNRATAEQASETALQEGLAPMMVWFKGVMDRIIQQVFGFEDLEFTWDDVKQIDVAKERDAERADVMAGIISIDQVLSKRGMDPIGMGHAIMGGPNGFIFLADIIEAQKAGLTRIQPPTPPPTLDEFGQPIPGASPGDSPGAPPNAGGSVGGQAMIAAGTPATPSLGSRAALTPPSGDNPLAGIPDDILAAVGLGPQGPAGRLHDITRRDEVQTDPEMAHVPHRQVLTTLRAVEAMQKRARARRARRARP